MCIKANVRIHVEGVISNLRHRWTYLGTTQPIHQLYSIVYNLVEVSD